MTSSKPDNSQEKNKIKGLNTKKKQKKKKRLKAHFPTALLVSVPNSLRVYSTLAGESSNGTPGFFGETGCCREADLCGFKIFRPNAKYEGTT
jgi:hypothetical protein